MNLSKTAHTLASINFQLETDRLDAIAHDIAETEAAYDRGRHKTMELSQQLAAIRDNRRDGEAEAEALRAGEDIATIAKTEESIRGEREAVQSGMRALNGDLEQLSKDRQEVRDQAKAKLAPVFDGLVAELDEEARQLATRLAQIYSDAETIRAASGNQGATRLSTALRDVVDECACSNLIGRSKPVPASKPVADMLTGHGDIIKIAGGSLHLQHRTPRL
jgi:chromosome segregation ATPase